MFPRHFMAVRLIGALLVIGLLLGLGSMLYHAGEAQGYAVGLYAATVKDGATGVLPPPGLTPYGDFGFRPHGSPFGFLGGLFLLGLLGLLFFAIVGHNVRRLAWYHAHGGPGGEGAEPWARRGHHGGPHGPRPGWWCASCPEEPARPRPAEGEQPPQPPAGEQG